MAGLMNATTTVAVEKTIGSIQATLVKHKCRAMTTKYSERGDVIGLRFTLQTTFGERVYELPVNVDGVFQVMLAEKRAGHLSGLANHRIDRDQALRVSWRILKDWIEAQLAICQTRAVLMETVMMPYMLIDEHRTVYQAYAEQQQALLPSGAR